MELRGVLYEVTGRIARVTLNRPERGNGIDLRMPSEIAHCVERACLDPGVHLILLSGRGKGFCGGYDLQDPFSGGEGRGGTVLDPAVQMDNHDPSKPWDPTLDYAFMARNVRAYTSLFSCEKPVVCKVHGFCVAGGTDLALCSDLLLIEATARIGYPPARVWGVPTTALWVQRIGLQRAARLLFTGDCLTGAEAAEWGLAIEAPPADALEARTEALCERIATLPLNQLVMMKLLLNQGVMSQGLHTSQLLGTFFDGVARHTAEGHAFLKRMLEAGFKQAVRERDEPFGEGR